MPPSRRRAHGNSGKLEIAALAARMLAEGTADTMESARRKAAERSGARKQQDLPDNRQIHAALLEYQALFEGDRAVERNQNLRTVAARAMEEFDEFNPRLVGPVLYGSACRDTPITLHLFSDEVERITRHLCNRRIDYSLSDIELEIAVGRRARYPRYAVQDNRGHDLELLVFPERGLAHPPLSSLDRKPCRRLDRAAVFELIDATAATTGVGPTASNSAPP